jgi:hypothetical protein
MGPKCCAFWIGTVLYWSLMSCRLLCWVQRTGICDVSEARVSVTLLLVINHSVWVSHTNWSLNYFFQNTPFGKSFMPIHNFFVSAASHNEPHARTRTHAHTRALWNVTADEKWEYVEMKPLRLWGCNAGTVYRLTEPSQGIVPCPALFSPPHPHPQTQLINRH